MGSTFKGTDQPPTRSALLTANWRGWWGAAVGTTHENRQCVRDSGFSERLYEKMYNGSRSRPALERGVTQADESRRRGVIMEAIAGVDIAVWDAKAQVLGIPLYQALGAAPSAVSGASVGLHRRY